MSSCPETPRLSFIACLPSAQLTYLHALCRHGFPVQRLERALRLDAVRVGLSGGPVLLTALPGRGQWSRGGEAAVGASMSQRGARAAVRATAGCTAGGDFLLRSARPNWCGRSREK